MLAFVAAGLCLILALLLALGLAVTVAAHLVCAVWRLARRAGRRP